MVDRLMSLCPSVCVQVKFACWAAVRRGHDSVERILTNWERRLEEAAAAGRLDQVATLLQSGCDVLHRDERKVGAIASPPA